MSRRWLVVVLLLLLLWPAAGWTAGEWIEMYPADRLVREKPRLEARANQLLGVLRTLITKALYRRCRHGCSRTSGWRCRCRMTRACRSILHRAIPPALA